ncbi:MAG: hypothetical protein AB3N15_10495 [Paracoccaceae bacterium]
MAQKETFQYSIIILDSNEFRDTRFEHCNLVYRGGRPPVLVGCEFIQCNWVFENGAKNTVDFLAALAKSGAQSLVLNALGLSEGAIAAETGTPGIAQAGPNG